MGDILHKLTTPEECMRLAGNVKVSNPELAKRARRKAVELRASFYEYTSDVELQLLKALYAYEEVLFEKNKRKTRATRTWQMIKRYGIIGAAERAVDRKIEPIGYKLLTEMGMHDLTFEAVIVRYPHSFKPEVVSRAKSRLTELSQIQSKTEKKEK